MLEHVDVENGREALASINCFERSADNV